MEIPAFSMFSAVSELVVTAAVLHVIVRHLKGRPFNWKLLGVVLTFETCINVIYMIKRASAADVDSGLAGPLKILFAVHGILSLVMLVALILVYLLATFDQKAGRSTWFQQHHTATWGLLFFWLLAVGSGEYAFVWRYFITA